jgi:hypothetical protein
MAYVVDHKAVSDRPMNLLVCEAVGKVHLLVHGYAAIAAVLRGACPDVAAGGLIYPHLLGEPDNLFGG